MLVTTHRKHTERNLAQKELKFRNYPEVYTRKSSLWKISFLLSISLNYFITSFSYVFLKDQITKKIYYTILILDVIYILNYIAAVLNYFWRKIQFDTTLQPAGSRLILIIDFLLAFPYSYMYETLSQTSPNFYIFLGLRAVLILRLFHLVLYFKQWNPTGINCIKVFGFQYLVYLLTLIHTKACIWHLSAFPDDATSKWTGAGNFQEKYKLISEKYFVCVYYALTTITNRNFGDITPTTTTQKILSTVFLCLGFASTTGIFVGVLSFLLDITHKRRTNLKMELQNILKHLNSISAQIKNQELIKNYYKLLWTKNMGVYKSTQQTLLPHPLNYEICVDITIYFLQTCTFFHDKPDSLLRKVAHLIKHEFYQPGEFIYHRNVVKNKMIFLMVGTIEILSHEDDESSIIALKPGTCLGESSLILTLPAKSSVRTASYAEIQVLYRKDFLKLLDFFPDDISAIFDMIARRIAATETEIIKQDNVDLSPYFIDDDTVIKTVKDRLRKKIFIPREKYKYLYMYKIRQTESHENTPCLSQKFPWILHPDSSLRQLWDFLVLIVVLYINIVYPYYIIFLRTFPPWFSFFFNFIDLFLAVDVVIILTTAIDEKDKMIKTFTEITQKRLMQIGFYLDFFSCIKAELFYWIWTRNKRFSDVLKLNRLVKIYRIPKLLRKIENKIEVDIHLLQIAKYIFYLCLSAYWFGGFLYLITCFEDLCTEDGWFFMKLMDNLKKEMIDSYTNHELFTSIYFALSCLTGLTPGDILPRNLTEMAVVSFLMICGFFTFSCCVAQSSALLTRKLKVRTDFQDVLFPILTHMKTRKNMGKDIVRRVKNYFLLQWFYDKANVLKEQPTFFDTNENIQTRIQIDEKLKTITNVPLFEGLDLDFLLLLAKRAKTLILPPNEFVTYKGEILKIMYIIDKGYCLRQFEKSYVIIEPKSFFGTMCVFSNVNSLCTVKTLTHVKLFFLTEEVFWKTASIFPGVVSQFKRTIEDFDILSEFKKIPIYPTLSEVVDLEVDEIFEGSFINVVTYCREYDDDYGRAFRELGVLLWIELVTSPICILPYGSFLKGWMMMRLIVAVVITVLTPFQIIQTPHAPALDKILFVTDIICYVDLYVMMFVGFYGDQNQLIIHPLKTAAHYIKGKFMLDFAFCFPWEIFPAYFHEESISPPNIIKNIHIAVKVIRMGQIYRMLQFFDRMTYIRRKINSNVLQILKYIPMTLVFIHFWTTIVVANSCKYYSQREVAEHVYNESFVQPEGFAHHEQKALTMFCNQDSWIDRSKFRNFTKPYEVYVLAVYFCTQILTLSGLGDITPQYISTLIIVVVMIMSGILFNGYVYAKISSRKAHWDSLLFKYQEIMTEMKKFMVQESVHDKLQQQIIERIEYKWKRSKGVEQNKILITVHPALYEDTVFAMYENTLRKVPIFENVDRLFLRIFGKIIKERCYLRQETIYRVHDVVSELCIIERGVVRVHSRSGHMEKFLETGGVFGNLTPNQRHKISISVLALSNVDLLLMDSAAFYEALKSYPSIKTIIERNLIRGTDFIVPAFRSSDISLDTRSYPETSASVNTFASLVEFKANIIGFLLMCLPWKTFRIAIPHYSTGFAFFDIYCLLLTYTNAVLVTYEFAFQDHSSHLIYFGIYSDVTYIFKILIEMHKTYENRYGEVVTSNKKILKRYFQGHKLKRILDFTVNSPFYYFVFLTSVFLEFETYLVFSALRLITLYRLSYFFDHYREKLSQLMSHRLLLKMWVTLVWATLVVHTLACGWYLCACPLTFCFEDSWVHEMLNITSDKVDLYVTSAYFIVTLLTKTGVGDVIASNIQEQVYISIVMISAIFVIGIFIGEIWNLLNSATVSHVKYEHGIKELKQHVQNNKISKYQLKKMWRYVRQLWWFSKGNQIPEAISLLHSATLQELMVEIYGYHLKHSYIFSGVEDSFARQVCQYLKRTIYFPGNYIVQHGDFESTMYFIHFGEVDILSVHRNLTETVHEILHRGDMFGVIQGLYHNIPHHFSFRARTTVHIVGLHLSDWEHLLDFFPESRELIFDKTNKVNV